MAGFEWETQRPWFHQSNRHLSQNTIRSYILTGWDRYPIPVTTLSPCYSTIKDCLNRNQQLTFWRGTFQPKQTDRVISELLLSKMKNKILIHKNDGQQQQWRITLPWHCFDPYAKGYCWMSLQQQRRQKNGNQLKAKSCRRKKRWQKWQRKWRLWHQWRQQWCWRQ